MTQSEYLAFEARGKRFLNPSPAPCEDESALHGQIIAECKRNGWLYFHGRMDARTGRTRGEPDFIIIRPERGFLLIECKAKNRKRSMEQLAVAAHAEKVGVKIHVVNNFDEFMCVVESERTK